MKIIAIDKDTNEEFEVNDLYFFEENMIHSFNDSSTSLGNYRFEFIMEPEDIIRKDYLMILDKEDVIRLVYGHIS